jgi:hypothetical protein
LPGTPRLHRLVNSKGEGYKIRTIEIDSEFEVPHAVEGYDGQKKEGAVRISLYGMQEAVAVVSLALAGSEETRYRKTKAPSFGAFLRIRYRFRRSRRAASRFPR